MAGSFCSGISCPSLGGLGQRHSLHCNDRVNSFSAVSTAYRLVCPVRAVIRARLAAAVVGYSVCAQQYGQVQELNIRGIPTDSADEVLFLEQA